MSRLRLGETLHRAPGLGGSLSSVWLVVLSIIGVHVLHNGFGWIEDDNIRMATGFCTGIVLMIAIRLFRGGRY